MHELSVALEVCRLTEAILRQEGGVAVRRVGVQVGADAGIEPENLRFCLDALLEPPPFNGGRSELVPAAGDTLSLSFVEVDDGRPDD